MTAPWPFGRFQTAGKFSASEWQIAACVFVSNKLVVVDPSVEDAALEIEK
jgi:hypothetical protein